MSRQPVLIAPPWTGLIKRRWGLAAGISMLVVIGQLVEELLFATLPGGWLLGDLAVWAAVSGVTAWSLLTWIARREQRYLGQIAAALAEQERLVGQLRRSNTQLMVLSTANKTIADSSSLDQLIDAALRAPTQLVPAQAVVVVVRDQAGPLVAASSALSQEALDAVRARFQPERALGAGAAPQRLTMSAAPGQPSGCLLLPLRDGAELLGWLEIYGDAETPIAADEQDLLDTIAGEFAEAIAGLRRRLTEQGALFRLEQAIMEDRARIARDIHDGIAQTLAFRRMRIDLWLDWLTSEPERLREELVGLKQVLREQIAELRRAIFALRPMQFDELGFIGGLQRYLAEFAGQHGWALESRLSQPPADLPSEIEALCFRIIQEALNNVAKHTRAAHVLVVFEPRDGGLRIAVRDDGGAPPPPPDDQPAGGLGLRQIRERLAALQGRMALEAAPGAGTTLEAWFPWPAMTKK